ncbi:MAG TPA: hypothetical protein VFL93_11635 [Longimicrobiaceae bacterium]|nr:hypothetical protein [Longimicrobiaceae bacterium]
MLVIFNPHRVQIPGEIDAEYGAELAETREFGDFVRAAGRAWGGLLVLLRLPERLADRLARFGFAHPDLPLILASEPDAELLARAAPLRVRRVIWLPAVAGLVDALRGIERGRALVDAASAVERSAMHPVHLRRAVVAGLSWRRPFDSVAAMARLAGCSYDQLRREWRQAMGSGSSELALERFIDRVALLRALERKELGRPWPVVADEIGIPYKRLERMARRACGTSLAELRLSGITEQVATFRREILDPLLGRGDPARRPSTEP